MSASPARVVAHRVLRRVTDEGAFADRAFRAEADRARLDARDRAFAQQLAYGTVQRLVALDHVLSALADRPLDRHDAPATLHQRRDVRGLRPRRGAQVEHALAGPRVEHA